MKNITILIVVILTTMISCATTNDIVETNKPVYVVPPTEPTHKIVKIKDSKEFIIIPIVNSK